MREFQKNVYTICDLCKRCQGIDNNDMYVCKYNKNNIEIGWSDNSKDKRFKCKYFKRHYKYILSNFMCKKYKRRNNVGEFKINYKQGKFIVRKTL